MFQIDYTDDALADLREMRKNVRKMLVDSVDQQLVHEPMRATKNKKLLRSNPLSEWELRVGDHRIFYDVNQNAGLVLVKAIGIKRHNRLVIRGEEFDL